MKLLPAALEQEQFMYIVLPSKFLTLALEMDVVARGVIGLLQLSASDTFAAMFALP